MTRGVCPIEIQNWVLTSRGRITTPAASVAEDYYKSKAAQAVKGRVVKARELWAVAVAERRWGNIWRIIKTQVPQENKTSL